MGTARGVFNSRKIERATFESLSFRFIAGEWHPDHDTLAHFRWSFLEEIKALFVEVLLLAQAFGDRRYAIENRDAYRLGYPSGHGCWEHDLKKNRAIK
jgi:Transposase domain (DUF772)